jgi:hypothetical protein
MAHQGRLPPLERTGEVLSDEAVHHHVVREAYREHMGRYPLSLPMNDEQGNESLGTIGQAKGEAIDDL